MYAKFYKFLKLYNAHCINIINLGTEILYCSHIYQSKEHKQLSPFSKIGIAFAKLTMNVKEITGSIIVSVL